MKKIIKSIPVYLTVVMILCCSLAVPAFASSVEPIPFVTSDDGFIFTADGQQRYPDGWCGIWCLPVGKYRIEYSPFADVTDHIVWHDYATGTYTPIFVNDGVIEITADMLYPYSEPEFLVHNCEVIVNSNGGALVFEVADEPVIDVPVVEHDTGFYYQAFDMFAGFIYGEGVELTAEQNMVLTILATTAVLFVVVVPFLIVFWFIRMFR